MKLAVAYDWLGNEIREGTRILWRNCGWGIGTVTAVYEDDYSTAPRLEVEWEKREYPNVKDGPGKGIKPKHVTAWPQEEATTSTSTLIFSGKADDD